MRIEARVHQEHKNTDAQSITRRAFVKLATAAAGAFATRRFTGCTSGGVQPVADAAPDATTFDLPSLGGTPDTYEGRTMAAFLDTVVPGAHRDPTGAPGAIDVDAATLFFDPILPVEEFVGLLTLVLDAAAKAVCGLAFTEATPEQREAAVDKALEQIAEVDFAIQMAKLAYFSSRQGGDHLGYPGPNAGYVNDDDFSFGVPLAREITGDGNLP